MHQLSVPGLLILSATLALGVPEAASASRDSDQSGRLAVCNATNVRITLTPGISAAKGKGSFTTQGPTGTLECRGSIRGREITGPGTFGEAGEYEGDCSGGTARSRLALTLPTADGPLNLSLPVSIVFKPGMGWKTHEALVGGLVFQYAPTRGNCVDTPVTEILSSGQAVVRSFH